MTKIIRPQRQNMEDIPDQTEPFSAPPAEEARLEHEACAAGDAPSAILDVGDSSASAAQQKNGYALEESLHSSSPEDGNAAPASGMDDCAAADAAQAPAAVVEPFLPTDYFSSGSASSRVYRRPRKSKRRLPSRSKRALLLVLAGLLVIGLCVGGAYAYNIFRNPAALFQGTASGVTNTPSVTPDPTVSALLGQQSASPEASAPAPSATLTPLEALEAQADTSILNTNILNVLVIGVDYAQERETWNGKHDYHADVMMVLAINLEENRVDLISLPRDTYANIPGVRGIYKLNASLNCGGGMEAADGAGFLKVCQAASWMLGGIPVNYYYAVTMPAVKELVDAFGGVDYELELNFTMAGRSYKKGLQHMDGQAVLDYLRVRKNINSSGDLNRVNRQKQMMVALFQQMQTNNLVLKIPDVLSAFNGQLFTNCTAAQTAALAAFAYRLDSSNIGMHSMSGPYTSIFGWNFVLTDQANRVEIIKQVYGLDVPQELEYSKTYAACRWQSMLAQQYLSTCSSMTGTVKKWIEQDDLLPAAPPEPALPEGGQGDFAPGFDGGIGEVSPDLPDGAFPDPQANALPGVIRLSARSAPAVLPESYQQFGMEARANWGVYLDCLSQVQSALSYVQQEAPKYLAGKSNSLAGAVSRLTSANSALKTAALQVAGDFGYSSGSLRWSINYWDDRDFNEVYVDFR